MDKFLVQRIAQETCEREGQEILNAAYSLFISERTPDEMIARLMTLYGTHRDRIAKTEALEFGAGVVVEETKRGGEYADDLSERGFPC